jgi:Asp-tRNA(Asn)/Glu-tRNA(Gln) amidotransferase A subunit family amidase
MTGLRDGELETAVQMAVAVRGGDVAPRELLERSLERLHRWQPVTNAFSQVWEDEALAAAGALTPEAARTAAGAPLAIKDLFDVAGHETTGCCAAYRGTMARADAPIVGRMRRAGMVFVGKTNQHELAAGGTNLVSACGRTANPWGPERMTGGSSGGSAAAVAAGVVPWALGSDTGGSIRIPSSMCGTFGIKPTTGLLPLQGLMPLAPSLDCPGPIASTAGDLHLLYRLMAGSGGDPLAEGRRPSGRRWRIGVPAGFFEDRVHADVLQLVRFVATTFEANGTSVQALDGRGVEDSRRVWSRICYPEFAAAHPKLQDRRGDVAPSVWAWIDEGRRLSQEERAEAASRREEIRLWYRRHLETFDALLSPSTPYPAPKENQAVIDLGDGRTVEADAVGPGWITCSVNLACLPALYLLAGLLSDALQIGVSLVGNVNREPALLEMALEWEAVTNYQPSPPPIPRPSSPIVGTRKDPA